MRGALLWKRILNQGVELFEFEQSLPIFATGHELLNSIIKSTIIVDSRPPTGLPIKIDEGFSFGFPFQSFWLEHSNRQFTKIGTLVCLTERSKEDGHFVVVIFGVGCKDGGRPFLISIGLIPFNDKGTVRQGDEYRFVYPKILEGSATNLRSETMLPAVLALDTLKLMGCKNVGLKPNDNEPDQVKRAVKRFGGDADSYRYHTLIVRPPGAKSDSPGQDIGIMPRHVCRGHFSEYGPEFGKGLLFGKYAGRFYIPPHLKGDKKNGVVEKDYAVMEGACA